MKYLIMTFLLSFAITAQEINIEQLESVTQELNRATQSPGENCLHCEGELDQERINKSITLESEEIKVGTNYVGGDNFVIALKRTEKSPKKIKLKIEYGERVCARTVAHQNALSGQIGFSCLFYQTEKRSKTIHLDFTQASVLHGQELQSLRLVLNKSPRAKSIDHKLKITNGIFDMIEKDRRILGMFGHEYKLKRHSVNASRSPAVIPFD